MTTTHDTMRAAIEHALYVNRYTVDEAQPHISITSMAICAQCAAKPCASVCPAAVYVWDGARMTLQYTGCLECGSCRFACPHANIAWEYPRGGFGVVIQHG